MRGSFIPFYWTLFPPCEGCTTLSRRFRPTMALPVPVRKFFRGLRRRLLKNKKTVRQGKTRGF